MKEMKIEIILKERENNQQYVNRKKNRKAIRKAS